MPRHLRAIRESGAGTPPDGDRIRVVLADDHPSLRRSLKLLLDSEPDMRVVGEAGDLSTALRQARRQRPRVLVLDLRLPDGSGAQPIHRLREASPSTEIVVVTMHRSRAFAELALSAGAVGFVLKDAAEVELCDAVRCAASGLRYISPRIT